MFRRRLIPSFFPPGKLDMVATRQDVDQWIVEGRAKGARWIISVCDTYDYEDYPVFVNANEDLRAKVQYYHQEAKMQSVNEIISLEPGGKTIEDISPNSILNPK